MTNDHDNGRCPDCDRRRWIPVTERLPETGGAFTLGILYSDAVLIVTKRHAPTVAMAVLCRSKDGGFWWEWDRVAGCGPDLLSVTHWMPLPEAP